MPQQTNWIVKTFTQPQTRFEVAIHFPQGARAIKAKGDDAGKSYRVNIFFALEIQYQGESNWISLPGITFGGAVKDGFTKKEVYGGTSGTVVPTDRNACFDSTRAFSVRVRRETSQVVAATVGEEDFEYKYYYTSILQSITGYKENTKPVTDPKNTFLAKTALSVLASNQLNGQIDGINALAQTYCLDWNGTDWVMNNTSNPASLFLYVLTHPANPQQIKYTSPATFVSDVGSKIDLVKLQYWHTYCNTVRTLVRDGVTKSYKFEYNNVLGNVRSILEVLRDISAAGRASPALVDGKWSVNIDETKSTVQHFTPHNSWGFESVKNLPRIPDGLKIKFFNEEQDYKEDELIVYNFGKSELNAELFESITLPGVTNSLQVEDHGKWHFAQIKLRPEIYTLNTDIEYLVCNRGDRVKITHDVPLWGLGSGRIKNRLLNRVVDNTTASVSCLELDESIFIDGDTAKNYTLRVRSATGSSTALQIKKSFAVTSYSYIGNTVTLTLSSVDHPLEVGSVVTVAVAGIINGTATLTQVSGSTVRYTKTGLSGSGSGGAGSVLLTSGYYTKVQLTTNVSKAQADPLDLFLFGELNRESNDLIVLSIEPTGGAKNARITLVDYGVTSTYNIFTDYKDLSNVNYETLITEVNPGLVGSLKDFVPVVDSTKIYSDDRAMELVSPGVFVYGILVPFTNPQDLPDSAELVQAEVIRSTVTDPIGVLTEPVSIQKGSILIKNVDPEITYSIRLRYVTTSGIVGKWTAPITHIVTGKTIPPENVSGFDYTITEAGIQFNWNNCRDSDYSFTTIKTGVSWTDPAAEVLFSGKSNSWLWTRPVSGTYTIFAKHVDVAGNESDVVATIPDLEYYSVDLGGVIVSVTNDNHQVPCDVEGKNPIFTGSGTQLYVFEYGTQLNYSATTPTTNGTWTITSKVDSGVTSGAITAGPLNAYAVLGDLSAFTDTRKGKITFNIAVKTTSGTTVNLKGVQNLSKLYNGYGVKSIVTSTPVVYKDSSSNTISGTFSTITVNGRITTTTGTTNYGWIGITPYIGATAGTEQFVFRNFTATPSSTDQTTKWIVKLYDYDSTTFGGSTITQPPTGTAVVDTEEIQVVFKGVAGAAGATGAAGPAGASGTKSITISAFQWSNFGVPGYSQAFNYTWSSGSVSAYPSGWTGSASAAPGSGFILYQINLVLTDSATSSITSANWSSATVNTVGYRQDGSIGPQGDSYRIAYIKTTSATPPGQPSSTTGSSSVPSGWSQTPLTLAAGEYMYQSDGIYVNNTNTVTWGIPYLSNLKVGSLSAISADLGTVSISTVGSLSSSGKTYAGAVSGFFLGYSGGAYQFDVGDSTNYIRWNGSKLNISGDIDNVGTARFRGNNNIFGINAAIWAKADPGVDYGIVAEGTFYGVQGSGIWAGIYGFTNNASGSGVLGVSTNSVNSSGVKGSVSGNGIGVDAFSNAYIALRTQSAGTATALWVGGSMAITSTNLVNNLNADFLDGYHAGNSFGQIPINNDVTNPSLVAGYLGFGANKYYFSGTATTGSSTANFAGTTKPGSTSTNQWVLMNINGTNYYVPAWPA